MRLEMILIPSLLQIEERIKEVKQSSSVDLSAERQQLDEERRAVKEQLRQVGSAHFTSSKISRKLLNQSRSCLFISCLSFRAFIAIRLWFFAHL